MTLRASEPSALFALESPPQTGNVADVVQWTHRMLSVIEGFLRRPEFAGLVLTRIDTVVQPEFKAEDGFLVYVGPGVLGPNEGLYVRERGTWKKLAGT